MSPAQHLDWFRENTEWFAGLPAASLEVDVPACAGWTVADVVTHLAYGLGLAYPYGMSSTPDCAAADAFADVPWPAEQATGPESLAAFDRHMGDCLDQFSRTDPTTPCWTYAGPGTAAFWFRRAAIETTLHRMDVAEALGRDDPALADERANDAIADSVEFALPLAAEWSKATPAAITVRATSDTRSHTLGVGEVTAEISGDGTALLSALWGRSRAGITVSGDQAAADAWMTLVEQAFAGR